MPCFHPMVAYQSAKNGTIKIFGQLGRVQERDEKIAKTHGVNLMKDKRLLLPCGNCIGCRLDYSREWADRCYLESKLHSHNYWLTLTYDDEHLKTVLTTDTKTGEVVPMGTLVREDLQKFIKRIREHWERVYHHKSIRYFGCGEYGSKYLRPHYHLSLFNFPIPDIKIWYKKDGHFTYTSDTISAKWGKGIVTICENSWATSAYTARYMLKKAKGRDAKEEFNKVGIAPEFIACSLKPGIGKEYFDKHWEEIYKNDRITVQQKEGKTIQRTPPAYFDKLLEREDPELLEEIKARRQKTAELAMTYKLSGKTTLNRVDYNRVAEENTEERAKQAQAQRKFESSQ